MRIKTGLVIGFVLGYYYGTMAGIERHHQLNRMIKRLSNSGPVDAATDKAKSAADTGLHKAKDVVSDKLHRGNNNRLGETAEFMPS